jgi:hypothetical protein
MHHVIGKLELFPRSIYLPLQFVPEGLEGLVTGEGLPSVEVLQEVVLHDGNRGFLGGGAEQLVQQFHRVLKNEVITHG